MAWERRIAYRRRDVEEARYRESWGEIDRKRRESDDRRGGRSRQWWEQEGKRRKDSILLGVDTSHNERAFSFSPTENTIRNPTIVEEGGEDLQNDQDNQEDISPHNIYGVADDHGQELLEARQGKKPLRNGNEDLETEADEGSLINRTRIKDSSLSSLDVQQSSSDDSTDGIEKRKSVMAARAHGNEGRKKEGESKQVSKDIGKALHARRDSCWKC